MGKFFIAYAGRPNEGIARIDGCTSSVCVCVSVRNPAGHPHLNNPIRLPLRRPSRHPRRMVCRR